jgi:glycosyltransferase involved in cell wall biosynthesis
MAYKTLLSSNAPAPVLSVVIPTLSKPQALVATVAGLRKHFVGTALDPLEIVVVNDGGDQDLRPLLGFPSTGQVGSGPIDVTILYGPNQGKGAALRAGTQSARGEIIAYIDDDGDYGPLALESMANIIKNTVFPAVVGSRHGTHGSKLRAVGSKVFSTWVWAWTGLGYDTQAGIKAFEAGAIKRYAAATTTAGFAYDVELLMNLARAGINPVLFPVSLFVAPPSTLNFKRALRAFYDVARLGHARNHSRFHPTSCPRPRPPRYQHLRRRS